MEEMIWPSPEFMASARTKPEDYQRLYQQSLQDPDSFWANAASQLFWYEPWQKVLQWDPPQARWFSGGKTNLNMLLAMPNAIYMESGGAQRIIDGEVTAPEVPGMSSEVSAEEIRKYKVG